jgi:transcriptional regulator with XRE-family HTH domain
MAMPCSRGATTTSTLFRGGPVVAAMAPAERSRGSSSSGAVCYPLRTRMPRPDGVRLLPKFSLPTVELMTGEEFAARVRELRRRRKLTQEALAEACDLASDTIRRMEHAGFSPSLDTLNKLAKGLGLTVTQLMVDNFDDADDLAAMIRGLPDVERLLALNVLGSLCVYTAAQRRRAAPASPL